MGITSAHIGLSSKKSLRGLFEHLPIWRNKTKKKPLPREVTPQGLRPIHKKINLDLSWTIVSKVKPLGYKIIACKLCLQDSTPSIYYSSGKVIEILSPFTQGIRSWLVGILHTLPRASANDFKDLTEVVAFLEIMEEFGFWGRGGLTN